MAPSAVALIVLGLISFIISFFVKKKRGTWRIVGGIVLVVGLLIAFGLINIY